MGGKRAKFGEWPWQVFDYFHLLGKCAKFGECEGVLSIFEKGMEGRIIRFPLARLDFSYYSYSSYHCYYSL